MLTEEDYWDYIFLNEQKIEKEKKSHRHIIKKKNQITPAVVFFFWYSIVRLPIAYFISNFKCIVQTNPKILYVQRISYAHIRFSVFNFLKLSRSYF
jgi:hypothetical protein